MIKIENLLYEASDISILRQVTCKLMENLGKTFWSWLILEEEKNITLNIFI